MDKRDFGQFYRENIDRIYRYVFFRTGKNDTIAEDLVSEIFMKALKAFDRYDPKVSKSAWIYRIAHNHLANYFRDRKLHVDIEDVAFSLEGEHGERTFEKREADITVEKALDELDCDERRLVTMKYLEGYSYKEMAEIIPRTSDALKVGTYRAMKKLRTIMKEKKLYVWSKKKT